jgi:hypothetical protein
MRSREVLANWLVCVAANAATEGELTFCSDPTGGDGIIRDVKTGETWPTEHVMVPGEPGDAETLILDKVKPEFNRSPGQSETSLSGRSSNGGF